MNDVLNCDQLHETVCRESEANNDDCCETIAMKSTCRHFNLPSLRWHWLLTWMRHVSWDREAFYRNFNCCLWKCIHGFAIFSAFFIFSSRQGWLETGGGDKRLSVCVVWQDKDCVIWKTLHSRLPYKAATIKRYSNISLFYSRVDHKIFVLFTIFSPPT